MHMSAETIIPVQPFGVKSPVYSPAYTMTSVGIGKFERQMAVIRTPEEYKRHIENLINRNNKYRNL